MGLFMGILADKFHRPKLIAIGVGLWSALTAISILLDSYYLECLIYFNT